MNSSPPLVIIAIFALLALIPARTADRKGYYFFKWWFYGFFLLPFALVHSFMLQPTDYAERTGQAALGYRACPSAPR